MSKELRLISPIPVSVNHYLKYRVIRVNGKYMPSPYVTKEAKEYKKNFIKYIQEEVKIQGWEMDGTGLQHYYMDWNVYFPRVDMDCSNYDKLLADSITESKSVWIDDNVVCNRINHIYYDSNNPRIELLIHPVEYIGIFDNKSRLDEFENKCKTCSRYKRNCSILKNAKSGRIQDEICDFDCSKYKEINK